MEKQKFTHLLKMTIKTRLFLLEWISKYCNEILAKSYSKNFINEMFWSAQFFTVYGPYGNLIWPITILFR